MQVELFGRLVRDFVTDELITPLSYTELDSIIAHWFKRHSSQQLIAIDTIPCLTCAAAGGTGEKAVPLAAFWSCYFLASKIFDSVQDDENHDQLWMKGGVKGALSIGLALVAAGNAGLSYLDEKGAISEILLAFGRAWAFAAKSQSDSQRDLSLENYFANVIASTAEPFATAAWSGARLTTETPEILDVFTQYGLNIGIALAIMSDCRGLESDVSAGIYKLPVIYAMSLERHPFRSELADLLQRGNDQSAHVDRTLEILQAMQAIEWSMTIVAEYQQRAKVALHGLDNEYPLPLFDHVV
jgi:geranylgeranyl pyrophosphate synthase